MEFSSVSELLQIIGRLTKADEPLLLLGGGSNLLLTADFDGTVLHSAIKGVELMGVEEDDVLVRVGSGETWDDFVALCVERGWYGAENLSLIPGEVGASAIQNIGAYGVEAKDLIERVEAVEIATGHRVTIEREECEYGYRQSRFKQDWKNCFVVTHVIYRLSTKFTPHLDYGNLRNVLMTESPTAKDVRQAIIDIRRAKLPDPKELGNGGSFFMNPIVSIEKYHALSEQYPQMPHYDVDEAHVKIPAGWMIEQCGWKGKSLGKAGVHDKQALVLVNLGGATGQEIVTLCETIRQDVFDKFGIDIRPEVNVV